MSGAPPLGEVSCCFQKGDKMLTRQENTGVSPPMKMPLSFGGVLLEEWVGG